MQPKTFPITIPKGTVVYALGRNRVGGYDPNFRAQKVVKKSFRVSEAFQQGEWVVWWSWNKRFGIRQIG